MDIIVNELQKFNFSKTEASVYVTLLKNGQMNGSQIAKTVGAARASVYSALETLYSKGAVFLIPGVSKEYKAKTAKILLKELKDDMDDSLKYLEEELNSFEDIQDEELFWNVKGKDNFHNTVKKMFETAESEIFINTNYDISQFSEYIISANKRGVLIVLFTFENLNVDHLPMKVFYNSKLKDNKKFKSSGNKRFMIIKDYTECFLANDNGKNGERIGIFTKNSLLVATVYEHIHHDIYLLKLEETFGRDWWRKVKLESMGEKHFHNEIGLKLNGGNNDEMC